jgi:hypothetical protein
MPDSASQNGMFGNRFAQFSSPLVGQQQTGAKR